MKINCITCIILSLFIVLLFSTNITLVYGGGIKKKFIYILFVVLSFNVQVFLADWDDRSKTEMRDAFIVSLNIFKKKKLGKPLETLAPGFLKFFADLHIVSETKLAPVFRSMMKVGFVQLKTIELDFNPGNIVDRQAPNGQVFALLPYKTHAVMVDNEIIDDDSVSFAFKTNERWYFVDLENPINIDAIIAIYPPFKDVDFTIHQ